MSQIKLGSEKLFFGTDAVKDIRELPGLKKKALIVMSGSILEELGLLKVVTDELDEAGFEWMTFDQVDPEPTLTNVLEGKVLIQAYEPDWIIGFGGGSAMDAAKAIWVMYENDKCNTLQEIAAPNDFENLREKAHLCCIPTSAGTGSEGTRAALIKDPVKKRKYSIRCMKGRLVPDVAILDPQFTKTMPKSLIAHSGMDALTHAIESYVSTRSTPLSKTQSLGSFLYGFHNIEKAYQGNDEASRLNMLAASYLGGVAFSNSTLGIVHSIAHAFGAQFDIPHGLANAIVLPYGIRFNSMDNEIYKQYEELSNYINSESLFKEIINLRKRIDIPNSMSGLVEEDVFRDYLNVLVEKAMNDVCTLFTPKKPTQEEMKSLILNVYYGDK